MSKLHHAKRVTFFETQCTQYYTTVLAITLNNNTFCSCSSWQRRRERSCIYTHHSAIT